MMQFGVIDFDKIILQSRELGKKPKKKSKSRKKLRINNKRTTSEQIK